MPWKKSIPAIWCRASRQTVLHVILAALALASMGNAANAQRESPTLRSQAKALTHTLLALTHRYSTADRDAKAQIERQILAVAKQRQQRLQEMLTETPDEVFALALPVRLRAGLPASVQAYVESRRELEGTLEVLYEDYEHDGRLVHILKTKDSEVRLHFATHPPTFRSGVRVRVSGVAINGELAVESGDTGFVLLAAGGSASGGTSDIDAVTSLPHTLGEQRTLVLLANFQDDQSQPLTTQSARTLVLGTVSQFIAENSQSQTWLTGDVYGWFTLPMSKTVCSLSTAGDAADQAATQAGVNVSAYSRIIYVFTKTACNVSGMGQVGAMPSRAYINGVATDLSSTAETIAHELGHNFGLNHSHALDCGDVALGTSCTSIEYGDTYDTLGNPDFGHFNAFQKERLGWMSLAGSPLLRQVGSDGAFSIGAYEASGAAPRVLKIPRGVDPLSGRPTWLYVEYRQALGFDSFLTERSGVLLRGDVTRGVVVHFGEEGNGNSSQLLHMNLDSQARQVYGFTDWFDPALDVGATFVDGASGLRIAAESADGTSASVRVAFGSATCVPASPGVSVSPAQASAAAGGRVTYTVTITNRDSVNCVAATYGLVAATPTGWSSVFANPIVSLLPGASTTATLDVTSASSATVGIYDVVATARNSAQSTLAGSATATYVVETSTMNNAPQAVDDTATTVVNTPVTIAVLANDRDPEGQPLRLTTVTQGDKGQATANADGTVTYRPNAKASGQDSFRYTVTDGSGSATATVSVQIGRRRK